MLRSLAVDMSSIVRAAVAMNPQAPPEADETLCADADPRVRELLARRLSAVCPATAQTERAELAGSAARALSSLVRDEVTHVRAAIADVVKAMPDAPRDLILRLAADAELEVCGPVIALSPLLTQEDLLALLTASPARATPIAVAARPDISAVVADAVVRFGDDTAVGVLLGNRSAEIREVTLDGLVARAQGKTDWHAKLVARPKLSPRTASALSHLVADDLLRCLAGRPDLPPALLAGFREMLAARLDADAGMPRRPVADTDIQAEAQAMDDRGDLNETALAALLARGPAHGRDRLAAAMLARAGRVPLAAVDRALRLRSPKALVSLVWRAEFSMDLAEAVQTALAHIPSSQALVATRDGGFPLSIDEMRFQLDFLGVPN